LIQDDFTRERGLLYLDVSSWQAVAQQIIDEKRTDKVPDLNKAMTFEVLDLVYPKKP
jgi:hypothetical protein